MSRSGDNGVVTLKNRRRPYRIASYCWCLTCRAIPRQQLASHPAAGSFGERHEGRFQIEFLFGELAQIDSALDQQLG